LAKGTLDPDLFRGVAEVLWIPAEETLVANTVRVGDAVLMAANSPRTREILGTLGLTPVELDVSEINKADGALTCCSILM